MDYIKDVGLRFSSPLVKRKKTDLIVLHHIEGNLTVQGTHNLHLRRGHKGIDYNFYVRKDGAVYNGRGLEYEGGHVNNSHPATKGVNARSVGIVCQGDFTVEQMPNPQKEALKKLVADIVVHYGFSSIRQIVTHREIAGTNYTDCPGRFFPADEVREFIRRGGTAKPTEDPLLWKVTVGVLNLRQGASTKTKVLRQLKRGDLVRLQRYVEGENWARVIHNGLEGWVWLRYIGER